jgi:TrmH family RNA methyltransferase
LRRAADRARDGAFVLEGPTILRAALDAGASLEAVYVASELVGPGSRPWGDLLDQVADAGVPIRILAPGVLERVADVVTPQGVLAVCRSITVPLSAVPTDGFVLVGIDIADPGNAGTMIRTADATGAAAIVFTGTSVDVMNPKVVRAAAGSMFHLPVVAAGKASGVDGAGADGAGVRVHGAGDEVHGSGVMDELARVGRRRLGAVALAGEPCDQADLAGNVALVVGNEARGLPAGLPLDGLVHVPMAGRAESLNVAMAATILCYEASRQRRIGSGQRPPDGSSHPGESGD